MSVQKAEMTVERIENGQYVEQVAYPYVEYEHVTMENGMDIMSMIRDDVSTPTVTHNTTSWKVGQGDSDVSETIVDSSVANMTIKGQTYQNILPSPSLRNSMTNGKTMQRLNEGYDSVNTVDGVCKSAILKGQTLVNLIKGGDVKKEITYSGGTKARYYFNKSMLKANVDYLLIYEVTDFSGDNADISFNENNGYGITRSYFNKNGIHKTKVNFSDVGAIKDFIIFFKITGLSLGGFINNVMLIEYQDGMENWDIPYFEGMQSVKMPVLTTIGKNVFDGKFIKYNSTYGQYHFGNGIYTYSITDNDISVDLSNVSFGDANNGSASINWLISNGNVQGNKRTITNRNLVFYPNNEETFNKIKQRYNIQIEQGSVATPYEPFKSNILTVNEPVELRGIGDVSDTLDCLTGEVTERIGEIVLDGSEERWELAQDRTNTMRFNCYSLNIPYGINGSLLKTDKLPYQSPTIGDQEGAVMGGGNTPKVVSISIMKAKLPSSDIDGFKQWLSQNPITIQYQLATESIKTVDLSILDQDNQPVTQLNSFANGYIQVSSQEGTLIPTTEYEVPTSNSYYVDLMKANTQYTMKNMQGTFTIDGIQYNASANGTFTSPSTLANKFMITNVVQTQPMLLEGDMTSKEVPYVEGIKSAFEGVDKVEIVSQNADNSLSNTTSFQLAHPLRSLPNSVRDEIVLDRVNHKAKIIQRVGEDLTQLDTPIVTEVNLEGYPYVYKGGHIFLNTEIAPITEMTYSINQAHQIESSNEDILRHQNEINHLYQLIAQYVQVQYEAELIDIALQG